MKKLIDVIKKGDDMVAIVINHKTCYTEFNLLTYGDTMNMKKHFKIVTINDLSLKLKQIQGLA